MCQGHDTDRFHIAVDLFTFLRRLWNFMLVKNLPEAGFFHFAFGHPGHRYTFCCALPVAAFLYSGNFHHGVSHHKPLLFFIKPEIKGGFLLFKKGNKGHPFSSKNL
jgi:hypothetical protein